MALHDCNFRRIISDPCWIELGRRASLISARKANGLRRAAAVAGFTPLRLSAIDIRLSEWWIAELKIVRYATNCATSTMASRSAPPGGLLAEIMTGEPRFADPSPFAAERFA